MAAVYNLVEHIYTADPSAHVFEGKIYVYPSHDRETDIEFNDHGGELFFLWFASVWIGVFAENDANNLQTNMIWPIIMSFPSTPWEEK